MNGLLFGTCGGRWMSAEPGAAGGAAPVETPPAADAAPAGDAPAPVKTPPAADAAPAGKPPAKGGDGALNLLDDAGEAEGGEPPSAEEAAAWRRGVKALDLGDGVAFDDALLDRLTPALMRLSGGDPARAEEVVRAYTGHALEQARLAAEREEAFNASLVAACRERWGADVRRVARLADAGGRAVFGDDLWGEIRSVRQFANNPDIMERLAAFGRGASPDRGVSPGRGAGRGAARATLSQQLGI